MSTETTDIEIERINRLKIVLAEKMLVKIASILKVNPRELIIG